MRRWFDADPVIPDFEMPQQFNSSRQYVLWTKRARDILIKYHRYPAHHFIRVGKSEPSMSGGPMYPTHWHSSYWRKHNLVFIEHLPRNAIVYWPPGTDICGDGYDPRDPCDLLADIQHWMKFKYPDDDQEAAE